MQTRLHEELGPRLHTIWRHIGLAFGIPRTRLHEELGERLLGVGGAAARVALPPRAERLELDRATRQHIV